MRKYLMIVLASFGLSSGTPDVSLVGVISDSDNKAIAGARLSLKNYPEIVATTDNSGAFSFTGMKVLFSNKKSKNISIASIKENVIYFTSGKKVINAAIDVFSLNGALVSSTKLKNIDAGKHHVNISRKLKGPSLVRFNFDNDQLVVKMIPGVEIALNNGVSSLNKSNGLSKKSADEFVDTLIAIAPGYRHALIGITSYDQQNILTSLETSNPWKPSGSLTHDNSMVKILAKNYDFEMGQPELDLFEDENINSLSEQPVHTVKFTYDFWMDTTEVTQKEFKSILGQVYEDYNFEIWEESFGVGDNYPAYFVSWDDAVLFCNAKSKLNNLDTVYSYSEISGDPGFMPEIINPVCDLNKNGYRLPTESEWEYACKGGTTTDFFWQKSGTTYEDATLDTAEISKYAVWAGNSYNLGMENDSYGTAPVASKLPNAYGLYDIIGNVSEACTDYWGDYSYGIVTDPKGPSTSDYKTTRGGCWGDLPSYLRSANRLLIPPSYEYYYKGFRTVKTIK
jgi:formylglycine-generating enzyme required for sulfatase activity